MVSKEYVKSTFLISISFILMKSFNLMLPYFLDAKSYNPVAFHNQECLQDLPSSNDDFPNVDFAREYSLALPIY